MTKANVKQERLERIVQIPVNGITLEGALVIPTGCSGVVLFAHGSGSSRHSPRNNFVAQMLQGAGLGTLLLDLLTREEDASYENRFDIDLLTWRLERATQWVMEQPRSESLDIGYFGASTVRRRRCRRPRRSVTPLALWCRAAAVQIWPWPPFPTSNPRLC